MKIDNLTIEWLGHAAFKLKAEGMIVYIDPFQIQKEEEDADYIFITHPHYDHCSIEDLQKIVREGTRIIMPTDCQSKVARLRVKVQMIIINIGKKFKEGKISAQTVPAYNTNKEFHKKNQQWFGYIIEIADKRIYHAGDTDNIPEMSSLGKIDIALLPVSGTYVMTAEEAAQAAGKIKPALAVPMHYGSICGSKDDADKFIELCKQKGIKAEKAS